MKIVYNTRHPDAASSLFYYGGLSKLNIIDFYKYSDLNIYNIALFMTYAEDLEDLKGIKIKYPLIKTGILDPRGDFVEPYLKYTDFMIVDSIEMYDYWVFSKKPIILYSEYPDVPIIKKVHEKKEKCIIGYHGNLVHLDSMESTVIPAIVDLSKEYDIEFRVMYNIKKLGRWNHPLSKNININHIQCNMENYKKYLAEADIGIVPNLLPVNIKIKSYIRNRIFNKNRKNVKQLNLRDDDYLLRFKMSSNPGRIIVFGKLGIPVVADFFPSAMQCIMNGENGFLAKSYYGWYYALEKLIRNHKLRQDFSNKMRVTIGRYDFEIQNKNLLAKLSKIIGE